MTNNRNKIILKWIFVSISSIIFYLVFTLLNNETLFTNYKTMVFSIVFAISSVFLDKYIFKSIQSKSN
jgi:hypothetical protein